MAMLAMSVDAVERTHDARPAAASLFLNFSDAPQLLILRHLPLGEPRVDDLVERLLQLTGSTVSLCPTHGVDAHDDEGVS